MRCSACRTGLVVDHVDSDRLGYHKPSSEQRKSHRRRVEHHPVMMILLQLPLQVTVSGNVIWQSARQMYFSPYLSGDPRVLVLITQIDMERRGIFCYKIFLLAEHVCGCGR